MKNKFLTLALCFLSLPAFALYQIGDKVSDISWTDVNNDTIHLSDHGNQIRVLLFNAGWCGPCNSEMDELVPQVSEFNQKQVTFISLSAEGWERGDSPDQTFLRSWKKKHHIPFFVAASPDDFGSDFSDQSYIPLVAIIDSHGKLAYSAVSPGADAIVQEVRSLLSK